MTAVAATTQTTTAPPGRRPRCRAARAGRRPRPPEPDQRSRGGDAGAAAQPAAEQRGCRSGARAARRTAAARRGGWRAAGARPGWRDGYAVRGGQRPPDDHHARGTRCPARTPASPRSPARARAVSATSQPRGEVRRPGGQQGQDRGDQDHGAQQQPRRGTPGPAGSSGRHLHPGRARGTLARRASRRSTSSTVPPPAPGDHRAAERGEAGEHLVALEPAHPPGEVGELRVDAVGHPGRWLRAGGCRSRPRAARAGRGWRSP